MPVQEIIELGNSYLWERCSPVEEPSLRKLQVGLMLVESKNHYSCYADNLSIQWSPENVPLPDSPWIMDPDRNQSSLLANGSALEWFSPETEIANGPASLFE